MDVLHLIIACAPLGLYLLALAAVNLSRRPRLISGTLDTTALALAISGLAVIGPMELFMPQPAANKFGAYVWLLLLSFYGLCVALYLLLARPRLVVFNLTAEQLRPVLSEVVTRLDADARWAGDNLALPQLGLQLHLDSYPPMRNVSLVASGERQSFSGWQRLQQALAVALRSVEVTPNPRGFSLLAFALVLMGWPLYRVLSGGDEVAQQLLESLRELLRL